VVVGVLDAVGRSLSEGFSMFWATLWALVLGFGLSGAVQAFVSRTEMQRALGDHRPAALGRASFFGVVSSSCSYAATALAKSLFARGADFTASMVFMVASTNLVVELGIVLWLLIGWQFALAEFVGGAIMIVLLGLLLPRVIPRSWIADARASLQRNDGQPGHDGHQGHEDHEGHGGHEGHGDLVDTGLTALPWRQRLRSKAGWSDGAAYTISDLTMLRRELVIGFAVAGTLAALVPASVWQSLFWTGHGFASSVENVVLGPFLAIISFVCSVGNVPLAAALWKGGISFGGVISFVFADLITLPLLAIYRRYFGTRLTLRLLGAFWAVMSAGGLATEYLFKAVGLHPPVRPRQIVTTGVHWDYTTVLDIIALVVFAGIYWVYRHRERFGGGHGYAKDPVCGMQVEIAHAPAAAVHDGVTHRFCSDHCQHRFVADPDRYTGRATPASPANTDHTDHPDHPEHAVTHAPNHPGTGEPAIGDPAVGEPAAGEPVIDPVCGMTVDPTHPGATASHDGVTHLFCGPGCAAEFTADPGRHLLQPGPAAAATERARP